MCERLRQNSSRAVYNVQKQNGMTGLFIPGMEASER